MKRLTLIGMGGAWLAGAIFFSATASAQQKTQIVPQKNQAYDVSRESVLQGTVLTYTAAATAAPLGAHVTVQTSSGVVDVHLGNAQLLTANHFSLVSGDSVRITGENVAYGTSTQFLARVIQKGNQALAVRSVRGFPLAPSGKLGPRREGGAL
jgi:DNA/RNA endonuclease YhcR with UshA esterase domain